MKAIGNNLSNASFIPTRPYRNARKNGGRYRRGMHDVLLAEDALPTVTQTTMTIMMKTIAVMAMMTADTIERAAATTLPHHSDTLPLCTNNDRNLILPTLWNTIRNDGSMTRISAYKSDTACLNHPQFLGSDSEHPKLKLRFIIDNSCANIILTRMIQRSLV